MKRYLRSVICFTAMFITASCAWAGYYNEGHYGLTEDDAYVIDSIADFVEFRNRINNGTDAEGLYYKLGISLNLEGTGSSDGKSAFLGPFMLSGETDKVPETTKDEGFANVWNLNNKHPIHRTL